MRFSKVHIDETRTSENGIKAIDLIRLGAVVALVGKNGAGKSRILKLISSYPEIIGLEDLLTGSVEHLPPQVSQNIFTITDPNNRIAPNQKQAQREACLSNFHKTAPRYLKVVDNDVFKAMKKPGGDEGVFQDMLSNRFVTEQPTKSTRPNLSGSRTIPVPPKIIANEFHELNSSSTIDYFRSLATQVVKEEFRLTRKIAKEAGQDWTVERNKLEAAQLFQKFQSYVKLLLGKEFDYEEHFEDNTLSSTLFFHGNQFDFAWLSPGQRALFAYAILLFYLDVNSKANIRESILFLDEPEKHLHPEAQVMLIDRLRDIVGDSGQLWIATHSVHILSHLQLDEIFMVDDGIITPPSTITPGKSLDSLMGLSDHLDELASFINSTSEWAYANFMRQCFLEPEVVQGSNKKDPQYKLFRDFIDKHESLKILDFGAGKGRFAETIQEDEVANKKLIYAAYEPDEKAWSSLNSIPIIAEKYRDVHTIPQGSFDVVVLCNVLHEIDPREWLKNFDEIKRVLKPGGYLLCIEDKFLPKGENANECGYLILGASHLRILFNCQPDDLLELKAADPRYRDRILFAAINGEKLQVSLKSVKGSVEALESSTYTDLKTLRSHKLKDIRHGRLYANQSQLFINAKIALEKLKGLKSKNISSFMCPVCDRYLDAEDTTCPDCGAIVP